MITLRLLWILLWPLGDLAERTLGPHLRFRDWYLRLEGAAWHARTESDYGAGTATGLSPNAARIQRQLRRQQPRRRRRPR